MMEPRNRAWQRGHPVRRQHRADGHRADHRFLDGIVRYTETRVYYDDFTDHRVFSVTNPYSQQHRGLEVSSADKRPRVGKQMRWRPGGRTTPTMPIPIFRLAVFKIPKSFFEIIRARLRS